VLLLTLILAICYFNFLFNLAAGNINPGVDLLLRANAVFPSFAFLLDIIVPSVFGLVELNFDDDLAIGVGVIDFLIEVVFLADIADVDIGGGMTGGTYNAGAEIGALLSNRASGTLEIVNAIEELV
jgi:hypothetical protein